MATRKDTTGGSGSADGGKVVAVVEGVLIERDGDNYLFELEAGLRVRMKMPRGVPDPKQLETKEARPVVRFEIRHEDALEIEVRGAQVKALLDSRPSTPFVFAEGGGLAFAPAGALPLVARRPGARESEPEVELPSGSDTGQLETTYCAMEVCDLQTYSIWGSWCDEHHYSLNHPCDYK